MHSGGMGPSEMSMSERMLPAACTPLSVLAARCHLIFCVSAEVLLRDPSGPRGSRRAARAPRWAAPENRSAPGDPSRTCRGTSRPGQPWRFLPFVLPPSPPSPSLPASPSPATADAAVVCLRSLFGGCHLRSPVLWRFAELSSFASSHAPRALSFFELAGVDAGDADAAAEEEDALTAVGAVVSIGASSVAAGVTAD